MKKNNRTPAPADDIRERIDAALQESFGCSFGSDFISKIAVKIAALTTRTTERERIRAEAFEEAAKLAEAKSEQWDGVAASSSLRMDNTRSDRAASKADAAEQIAKAIRALAGDHLKGPEHG